MSSTPSTSSSKQSQPGLNYEEIKSFLEAGSGFTDVPSGMMPLDDFLQDDSWTTSSTTQNTQSSSKTVSKYDPAHYQRGQIQVWDFIADQKLDFLLGNVIKYVCRAGHKQYEEELDDLLKAKAYIEKKIAITSLSRNR